MTDRPTMGKGLTLRRQAEKILEACSREGKLDPDVFNLIRELHLYQAELELQLREEATAAHDSRGAAEHERYVRLYDSAPCGYLSLDRNGTIVEANLTAARQVGIERDSLPGKSLFLFLDPPDRDTLFRHLRKTFASCAAEPCTLTMTHRSGLRRAFRLLSILAEEAEGTPICRTVVTEVSAGDRAELSRQTALLDLLREAVILRGRDGRIVFWNRAAEELYGWQSAEVAGKPLRELLRSEFPGDPAMMEGALAHEGTWEGMLLQTTRSGDTVRCAVRCALCPVGEGSDPDGVMEVHLDVTPQERVTTELRAAQAKLEKRTSKLAPTVAALKAASTEKRRTERERRKLELQLLRSQKMESLGILSAGIAHDFNNLLTAVAGFSQMVEENLPPETDPVIRAAVGHIRSAGRRATDLTSRILLFAADETPILRPADFNQVIREAGLFLMRLIGEDIRFTLDLADGPLPVAIEKGPMEQVLMNLAINARDAMRDGGELSFSTSRTFLAGEQAVRLGLPGEGDYVVFTARDSGCGIDPAVRERIFDAFFTTKGRGKGSGLGLSIVAWVVRRHSGGITVESEPGRGSRFTVYLPVTKPQEAVLPGGGGWVAGGGRETILIVEDDPAVREYLKAILQTAGYTVLLAGNGEEALHLQELHPPVPLVILDLVLPGKNGTEVLADLRRKAPEMKALFSSGYPDRTEYHGAGEAAARFLMKPVLRETLLRSVRETLDAPLPPR